jgi:hypothetical protein
LLPVEDAIAALVAELREQEGPAAGSDLSVLREFDSPDGDVDGGQHYLLGLHLSKDVVRFLANAQASIDVDEYGQDFGWWRPLARRRYSRS